MSRISDLEHLVLEKDSLVKQTIEEMAYIKRELLNREETYNKTFSRTPNIGVLQVLKPHVANPMGNSASSNNSSNGRIRRTKASMSNVNSTNNSGADIVPNKDGIKKSLPPIGATNQQGSFRDLNA